MAQGTGKAQEEDEICTEEYSADQAARGGKSNESHAGSHGYPQDAHSARLRRCSNAGKLASETFSELDKAIRKRTLSENTANRYKSRLALALNALKEKKYS